MAGSSTHRRIVFSDIDGTIIDAQKRVSAYSAEVIDQICHEGHPVCLVSARSPKGIDTIWNQLGCRGATASFSGAYVTDEHGNELFSRTIPLEYAVEIKRFLNREIEGVMVNAFGFDTWVNDDDSDPRVQEEENTVQVKSRTCPNLADAFDARGIHKFLLMGEPADLTVAEPKIRARFGDLVVARSNANLVEINAQGATKQQAIEVLCAHYGVPRERTIAFGDGHNDIPMLQAVAESYAMGNASDEVKRAAKHVIPWTNEEDGVARTLESLLLI